MGIAVDADGGKFHWTQKAMTTPARGRIFRANIEILSEQSPANRKNIELLYENPKAVNLDLDPAGRALYSTDRGDPPRGDTLNRAPMDPKPGNRTEPEILFDHLMEGIGLALDVKTGRMFFTDRASSVYSANLDGSNKKMLLAGEGNLTGIVYAELPAGH